MAQYRLTDDARRDLDELLEYIALDSSVERAMKVFARVRDGMRKAAEMPGSGHYREDLLDRSFKFWMVKPYLIVYRWDVEPIRIIAVVHGARDLDAFLATRT